MNSKVEVLLREAEGGSVTHLKRLCDEWPQNVSQSKRALEMVLRHFEAERKAMWELADGHRSVEDAARSIQLIRACLAAMDGALDYLINANDTIKEQIFTTLIPYLNDLVTWLQFFAQKSSVIMSDFPPHFGTSSGVDRICVLLNAGGKHLEEDPACVRRIVEFLLWAWTRDAEASVTEGEVESLDEYEQRVFARINAMVLCMKRDSETTRGTIFEILSLRSNRYHRRLAQTFCTRCQDWANQHRAVYKKNPQKVESIFFHMTVELALKFSRDAGFFRALRKCQFPIFVMRIAMEFPDVRMSLPQNQRTPLPAGVSKLFLPRLLANASDTLRLIPGLLDLSLLEVLIDDILSYSNGHQSLYDWASDDGTTPLDALHHNSHPVIVGMLGHATASLPPQTRDAMTNNALALPYWQNLTSRFEIHKAALAKYQQHSESDVRLCDNLEHHPAGSLRPVGDNCRQCSWCHAAVYCSEACQRRDWELIHKYECKHHRVERIELKIQHVWTSHHIRTFNLEVLEFLVSNNLDTVLGASRKGMVPDGKTGETKTFALVAEIRLTPLEVALETIDDVLKGTPVFRMIPFAETRFRALADGCRDDPTMQLACSAYMLGQYLVATMGKFLLPRGEVDLGKDNSELGKIALLNGFVKVMALDFIEFDENVDSE